MVWVIRVNGWRRSSEDALCTWLTVMVVLQQVGEMGQGGEEHQGTRRAHSPISQSGALNHRERHSLLPCTEQDSSVLVTKRHRYVSAIIWEEIAAAAAVATVFFVGNFARFFPKFKNCLVDWSCLIMCEMLSQLVCPDGHESPAASWLESAIAQLAEPGR